MARILFLNIPLRRQIYLETNVSAAAPHYPSLTIATLAAEVSKEHEVKVVDLELADNLNTLYQTLQGYRPDMVALSINTPAAKTAYDLARRIKEALPEVIIVAGGVHVTTLPHEVRAEGTFDYLVLGEGDFLIDEILSGRIASRHIVDLVSSQGMPVVDNGLLYSGMQEMDHIPFPAWGHFDVEAYKNSRISSRYNPVGLIETSRGCAFKCNFCNKKTFGTKFRTKSPERVVDEFNYLTSSGFKEIHITDDSFTQNLDRAKIICEKLMRQDNKFTWSLINGVRVDKVDAEFLSLAKRAGLWQIAFGIESGNDDILKKIKKGTTTKMVSRAVKLAAKAGIDTFGFFMLALTGETEETMRDTIDFSLQLPLSIAKFDIAIPYPGTEFYLDLERERRILSRDWDKYSCHQFEDPIYTHPNLSWDVVQKYYKRAFRKFYIRPSYFARRFCRDLAKGDLINDFKYFFKTNW